MIAKFWIGVFITITSLLESCGSREKQQTDNQTVEQQYTQLQDKVVSQTPTIQNFEKNVEKRETSTTKAKEAICKAINQYLVNILIEEKIRQQKCKFWDISKFNIKNKEKERKIYIIIWGLEYQNYLLLRKLVLDKFVYQLSAWISILPNGSNDIKNICFQLLDSVDGVDEARDTIFQTFEKRKIDQELHILKEELCKFWELYR